MLDRMNLIKRLLVEEGLKLRLYLDSKGIPTIGVGRNLRDKGISEATAYQMLEEDLDEVERDLSTLPWWAGLDPIRQLVLADMRFNLGPTRFREFKHMLKAVERKDYFLAAAEMLNSQWSKDVGTRAQKLAILMETGQD
jgi:lysozyme